MPSGDADLVRLIGDPKTCIVREQAGGDGRFDVLSPGVGLYDAPPAVGTFLQPGSFAGYLTILRRYFHLLIPEGHHGVVTHLYVSNRKQRVEYGQPLFTVSPEAEAALGTQSEEAQAEAPTTDDAIPEGSLGIRSPTDGIFYRSPNPLSPPYVEEGTVVSRGTVLALVEVMKCFNPIVYPGEPEFPAQARIARVVAKDSTEVKHGAMLFIVEPA